MKSDNEEWMGHYAGWRASGKTQLEYCELKEIRFWLFKNRIYQLRKSGQLETSRNRDLEAGAGTGKFQPIEVVEGQERKKAAYCEIRFGESNKITISSQERLVALKGMIHCIMQA